MRRRHRVQMGRTEAVWEYLVKNACWGESKSGTNTESISHQSITRGKGGFHEVFARQKLPENCILVVNEDSDEPQKLGLAETFAVPHFSAQDVDHLLSDLKELFELHLK